MKFCPNKSIFETPVVQAIVDRLWKANKKGIFITHTFISLTYIVLLNLIQRPDLYVNMYFAVVAAIVFILPLGIYVGFCFNDFKRFLKHDLWIFLDLILAILSLIIAIISATSF